MQCNGQLHLYLQKALFISVLTCLSASRLAAAQGVWNGARGPYGCFTRTPAICATRAPGEKDEAEMGRPLNESFEFFRNDPAVPLLPISLLNEIRVPSNAPEKWAERDSPDEPAHVSSTIVANGQRDGRMHTAVRAVIAQQWRGLRSEDKGCTESASSGKS